MPRETWTAPAALPLFSTSGASRTSTTSVLPLAIISRASAGVIRGTAALAASIICLTLVAMTSSTLLYFTTLLAAELRSIRFATRYHTSHGATGGRRTPRTVEKMVAARIARTARRISLVVRHSTDKADSQTRSHGRIGVPAAEREQAVGRAGDV